MKIFISMDRLILEFTKFITNSNFFLDSMADLFRTNDVWCVDGTFCIVPKPYYQLYTVSFLNNNSVFPVIFGILKDKSEDTYNYFYELIKLIVGGLGLRLSNLISKLVL
jgi:hypothetical protein